jgi:hypothetical protein
VGLRPSLAELPDNAGGIVIIALLLAWDAAMSGGRFVNRATCLLPRDTRLFWYLTYVLLVAANVAYFFNAPGAAGARISLARQSDLATQGFDRYGLAVLIFLIIMKSRSVWRNTTGQSASPHP